MDVLRFCLNVLTSSGIEKVTPKPPPWRQAGNAQREVVTPPGESKNLTGGFEMVIEIKKYYEEYVLESDFGNQKKIIRPCSKYDKIFGVFEQSALVENSAKTCIINTQCFSENQFIGVKGSNRYFDNSETLIKILFHTFPIHLRPENWIGIEGSEEETRTGAETKKTFFCITERKNIISLQEIEKIFNLKKIVHPFGWIWFYKKEPVMVSVGYERSYYTGGSHPNSLSSSGRVDASPLFLEIAGLSNLIVEEHSGKENTPDRCFYYSNFYGNDLSTFSIELGGHRIEVYCSYNHAYEILYEQSDYKNNL